MADEKIVKDGKCIDTSMGFTPQEGVPMGTRSGSVDPTIMSYVAEKEGLSHKDVEKVLNKKSGLLGISGVSSDCRDIEEAANAGNVRASLAQHVLCYGIKKLIGAYTAAHPESAYQRPRRGDRPADRLLRPYCT